MLMRISNAAFVLTTKGLMEKLRESIRGKCWDIRNRNW